MSLFNFFRINLPYGISRNQNGEWFAFNREYMPIGWNSEQHKKSIQEDNIYSEIPIYTKYKSLTELKLRKLAVNDDAIRFDNTGKIERVFFYNDKTNPSDNSSYWQEYIEKLKLLASIETEHHFNKYN